MVVYGKSFGHHSISSGRQEANILAGTAMQAFQPEIRLEQVPLPHVLSGEHSTANAGFGPMPTLDEGEIVASHATSMETSVYSPYEIQLHSEEQELSIPDVHSSRGSHKAAIQMAPPLTANSPVPFTPLLTPDMPTPSLNQVVTKRRVSASATPVDVRLQEAAAAAAAAEGDLDDEFHDASVVIARENSEEDKPYHAVEETESESGTPAWMAQQKTLWLEAEPNDSSQEDEAALQPVREWQQAPSADVSTETDQEHITAEADAEGSAGQQKGKGDDAKYTDSRGKQAQAAATDDDSTPRASRGEQKLEGIPMMVGKCYTRACCSKIDPGKKAYA